MRTCDQLKESRDTCEQAVDDVLKGEKNETNLRSLSPWEYCIDRDVGRFPTDISIARCLCQGCVTDQSNNMDYNSVPVCGQMMVLWRKKCPQNPDKYVVRKYFISVPVGCTCVRPGYTSSHK
ncbi:interleukin-17C-like [Melanotaenia boesemani]|uniref:interleukin-17C-like n=1 Tax=Melanotaenia boesemani TaxID=1250792 RepID=UPI001C049159|nr:interleukin-17C-like [Melanotaenia boesemani]